MVEREFTASVNELQNVADFIEEELSDLNCSELISAQIQLAVEEVFVNIANYAYKDNSGSMSLAVSAINNNLVLLTFSDNGIRFNPLDKTDPDITLPIEKREIGGLGIYLVKKTMDSVEYRYEAGKNILTLKKKIR